MNKSIVTFTRGTLAQATPLWQYDYGQVLEINGLELPATYQVHFCNCSDTQTITVLGNADGVLIPDNLLQTGKTVIAYIYLHTGADDGETEYKITIPIRTRPAPSDIPPAPEQQSALDEAIAALNSAVDTVEDIADGIPDQINTALEEAKESGEFDGPPGPKGDAYVLTAADREEIAGIASDDVLVVSDEEPTGEPLPKIWIDSDDDSTILIPTMEDIGDLDDLVTTAKNNLVAAINEAAQSGGGGGTSDYSALTNKPQIGGVELSGNKTAADLGLAPAGAYVKPSSGIPNSDLAEDAQRGYTSEEKATVFPEQTVTFEYVDPMSFSSPLQPDPAIIGTEPENSIVATFDGQTYVIPRYEGVNVTPSLAIYGDDEDENFTDFPFHVYVYIKDGVIAENLDPVSGDASVIVAYGDMTSGQHTFSAYFVRQPVTTTPDFDAAVAKSSAEALAEKLDTDGDAYRAASIPMGQLDSTSTATVMTATVPGITELRDGVCVWLKNGVIASASGVTLNINSLGAKPIYNSLSGTVVTTAFVAASTYLFVYNSTRVTGGCWDMVYGYDTNTTYTPVKLGFGYATCSTAEATAAKTAALSSYTLTTGGIVAVKFTNAVPAGATLNINSKGAKAIYYKGAAITAGVIKAGDTATFIYSTYYHLISIDRSDSSEKPDWNAAPGTAAEILNKPTKVSAFTNDAGYLTETTAVASADNWLGDALAGTVAANIPVFLYDGENGVYISKRPQDLADAYQSQLKMNFALVVPPNYNSYPVLFTPSKFDTTTGELHLTGITGGVLYEATLLPDVDPTSQTSNIVMVGTITTTNLALPSAQGVSF